jgi:hypothetical protein
MKRLLLLTGLLLVWSAPASAQWEFAEDFPPILLEMSGNAVHGIAVDPEGKVWIQPFQALAAAGDTVLVPDLNNQRVLSARIYVYNADGSPADFSPIRFLDYEAGTGLARDTLGGFVRRNAENQKVWEARTGRGLATDHNGNILISQFTTIFRVNYQTGMGMARVSTSDRLDPRGITAASADGDGNVYVTGVFPGDPIAKYDANFNFVENVVDADRGFSRTILALEDGTVLKFGYDRHYATIYRQPDEFSAYDSVGVTFRGMDIESATINPATGHVWVSAGSPNDAPNRDPAVETNWRSNTWYAFEVEDLLANEVPTPLESFTWDGCVTFTPRTETSPGGVCVENAGRPRGIGFSPNGEVAYVGQFSQPSPAVQKFIRTGSSAEPGTGTPETIALRQNYPNPFRSATQIEFTLSQPGHVALKVYDVLGREVAVLVDETLAADSYTATLRADGLAAGTYLYVLSQDGQRVASNRLQVVR